MRFVEDSAKVAIRPIWFVFWLTKNAKNVRTNFLFS